MPPVSNNSPLPLTPQLPIQPLHSWRPFRTVLPALITYISSILSGVGLFILYVNLNANSSSCGGFAGLLCTLIGYCILIATTLTVATILGIILLRRAHIERAWGVLLVAYIVSGVLSGSLPLLLSMLKLGFVELSVLSLVAGVAFFVASCLFGDWYLNVAKGRSWIKIVIIGLVAIVVVVALNSGSSPSITTQSHESDLRAALANNDMTLLIPPPNSAYPQPYSIAAQSNAAGQPDYRLGAYFGIDTGEHNGTTLYEYKIDNNVNPLKECGKISSMLVTEYNGHTTCELVTTLPSGTTIYGTYGGYSPFFIIKNGTAAVYSPPSNMTNESAYDFLDHLVPLEIETFLRTLHQKNPMQY